MESLIAMVIIIVSMGVASVIYSNVLDSTVDYKRFKANMLLNYEAEKVKKNVSFFNSESIINGWLIVRQVDPYTLSDNTILLSLKATSADKKITVTRKELILINE